MNFLKLVLSSLYIIILCQCNLINPEEEFPSYLYIDTISLNTIVATQGSNSHKITDAIVYVKGEFWGIYELPAKILYFGNDSTRIIVQPGIKENGNSFKRVAYPFYTTFIQKVWAAPLHIDTLDISTSYTPSTVFLFNETFDAGNILEAEDNHAPVEIETDPVNVLEGGRCVKMTMDTSFPIGVMRTISTYTLDANSVLDLYLEMNYRSETDMDIYFMGIIGSTVIQTYKVTIPDRDHWNKIYINFTPELLSIRPDQFRISINADHDVENTSTTIWIDNMKMVYQ